MREPALERVDDQEMPVAAREGLDQHLARLGNAERSAWMPQPLATGLGQRAHLPGVGQHASHALGEMRGERKLAALIGGDHRLGVAGARHEGLGVLQALEAQHLAGKRKRVAERSAG